MTHQQYPKTVRLIHWLTLTLIVLGVSIVLIRDAVEGKPLRLWLLNIHKIIGLLLPVVLILRVILILKFRSILPRHPLSTITKLVAKAVHLALYLALFAIPMLGWAQVSAKGQMVSFLGLIPLPALVQEDMDLAETLADWHEWAAYGFLGLIAIHALAALWHHYFKKDNVLRAMAPVFK